MNKVLKTTIGIDKNIRACYQPHDVEEIKNILSMAKNEKLKIHPVSTGKNWGYGTLLPYDESAIIVDMSKMNRIIEFDSDSGVVTIEPGVTQNDLATFLEDNNLNYMVPTTGAGPDVGILGNALERGYGLTPHSDHFSAVMGLKVLLADGTYYTSPFYNIEPHQLGNYYRYGVGPYYDGIFTQSNLGVVVEAKIKLFKKREVTSLFLVRMNQKDFYQAQERAQKLFEEFGSHIGGINYINLLRTASMFATCPDEFINSRKAIDDAGVDKIKKEFGFKDWTILGTIYCSKSDYSFLQKKIKSAFKGYRIEFYTEKKVKWINLIFDYVSILKKLKIYHMFNKFRNSFQIFIGKPSEIARPLIYWRNPHEKQSEQQHSQYNPDHTNCGIIWYAPIIPNKKQSIESSLDIMTRISKKYGFDPLITLTSYKPDYYIATLALIFNRSTEAEIFAAKKCYNELFEEGKRVGIFPYRYGNLKELISKEGFDWSFHKRLKAVLDPDNIIDSNRF